MSDIFSKLGSSKTLSQKIEEKIEEAIREKKLSQGAKLPTEKELCESFAVSRTSLREALRRLSARGLIEIKKGSGMYVAELKIEDAIKALNLFYDLKFDSNLIQQIIEARRIYEPEIAKLAAKNRKPEDLKILNDNLKKLENCNPDNTQMEVELINSFHVNLTKSTGNSIVIISMEPVYSLLPRLRNLIYENMEGEKEFIVNLLNKILKAVEEQNQEDAYKFSIELINRNMNTYINMQKI